MIELLADVPDGVLGFRFAGSISRDEYLNVLLPPMKAALEEKRGVRLLLVIEDDFGWFEPGAFWEDLKFGLGPAMSHHQAWERTAVISDAHWVQHAMGLFGWMVPGAARVFAPAEAKAAKDWLAA
jgi:hypothetical protein